MEVYIPNPVEDLSSSIGLHIVTGSHHDKSKSQDEHHQRVALWPTPNIEDFRQWELENATNEAGHDGGRSSERVLLKGARYIGRQRRGHCLLHGIDEINDPDPRTR
jgi:hypothetical protein